MVTVLWPYGAPSCSRLSTAAPLLAAGTHRISTHGCERTPVFSGGRQQFVHDQIVRSTAVILLLIFLVVVIVFAVRSMGTRGNDDDDDLDALIGGGGLKLPMGWPRSGRPAHVFSDAVGARRNKACVFAQHPRVDYRHGVRLGHAGVRGSR